MAEKRNPHQKYNNFMTIEVNVFDTIYPAVLRRFKIETELIENAYTKGFDSESSKELKSIDRLVEDIVVRRIDTSSLSEDELEGLIEKTSYEYRLSNRINDFLSYFTITSLYNSYEKYLRNIVLLPRKMDDKKFKSMSYISKLIPFMKREYGLDYNKIPFSKEIEEVRCLSNSIKHDRTVNIELSQINTKRWILNEEVENVFDDFMRLKEVPYLTLEYLAKEIKLIVENTSK